MALVDGELAWFLERGGRSLLSFTDDAEAQMAAASALADLVGRGRVQSLLVEKVNGVTVLEPAQGKVRAAVHDALTGAGFTRTRAACGCGDGWSLDRVPRRDWFNDICLKATPSTAPRPPCAKASKARRSPGAMSAYPATPPSISPATSSTKWSAAASTCSSGSARPASIRT